MYCNNWPYIFPIYSTIPIIPTDYVIKVKTSDRYGAASDANVFVQLFGLFGISKPIELKQGDNLLKFRHNQLDEFIVRNHVALNHLYALKIWHDNSQFGANWILNFFNASWHLEYVEISDVAAAYSYRFPCHKWLATDKADGKICRQLKCTEITSGQKQLFQAANGILKTNVEEMVRNVEEMVRKDVIEN